MSIVERAIRKLQESHQPGAAKQASPRPDATGQPVPGQFLDTADQAAVPREAIRQPSRSVGIDVARLRSKRLLPPPDQERELAAQYRQIKRPLIARGVGRGQERLPLGNAIMLTSALPGEGKTFTAVNLALSMALEQELRVLLVDADVAQPRLSREFEIADQPGLTDALRDRGVEVESLIIGTDVPTLTLLPAGGQTDTATELLAGPRMAELVRTLCENDPNRVVLFDSSPILPTTEARALAQAAGQVVLVVRAGETAQQAVLEALRLIGDRTEVSLVLTQTEYSGAGSYYYGNYRYGDYGVQSEGRERAEQVDG